MAGPARLLCEFGWHQAMPSKRWNGRYCFSRCARCGVDMVSTPSGKWRVPKGYKIVWKPKPQPPKAASWESKRPIPSSRTWNADAEAPPKKAPAAQERPIIQKTLPPVVARPPFHGAFADSDEIMLRPMPAVSERRAPPLSTRAAITEQATLREDSETRAAPARAQPPAREPRPPREVGPKEKPAPAPRVRSDTADDFMRDDYNETWDYRPRRRARPAAPPRIVDDFMSDVPDESSWGDDMDRPVQEVMAHVGPGGVIDRPHFPQAEPTTAAAGDDPDVGKADRDDRPARRRKKADES